MRTKLLTTGIADSGALTIVAAQGTRVRLSNGAEAIDAMTTPAPLGHRHPEVIEAACKAAREAPTMDEGWATARREAAAEAIVRLGFLDEEWVGGLRFALTGSEANDLALSLSQALTGRSPIATRERAYHGMVGLARDATVQPQWHGGLSSRGGAVRPVPSATDVRVLPFPPRNFGDGLEMSEQEAERILAGAERQLDGAAAVIVDYTQGGRYPAPAYQDCLARKARAAGALWIADEVITGFGKSGRWMNFQRGAERPDIVTLGKPLGGGLMPVAAVVLSKRLTAELDDASWQTYSALRATDLGAAAAQAFVEVVERDGLVERAAALHGVLRDGLRELAGAHPSVSRVDGQGLHWWIELGSDDWRTHRGAESQTLAARVAAEALAAGALVATSGERNVLLVTLPLVTTADDVTAVLGALDHGLRLADRELDVVA